MSLDILRLSTFQLPIRNLGNQLPPPRPVTGTAEFLLQQTVLSAPFVSEPSQECLQEKFDADSVHLFHLCLTVWDVQLDETHKMYWPTSTGDSTGLPTLLGPQSEAW